MVIIPSVFDVIRKKIGIGDLQYNLSMVGTLRSQVSDLVSLIANYTEYDYLIRKMHEFNDLAVIEEQSGTKIPSENPKIEFDHVTFRYPNSDTPILKDCSFTIEPSQKIGLIGRTAPASPRSSSFSSASTIPIPDAFSWIRRICGNTTCMR